MPTPFSHPRGVALLRQATVAFKTKKITHRNDRHVIFLCGGSVNPYSRSLRYRFLKYFEDQLHAFRLFRAEDASRDLIQHNAPTFLNIASFESLIADISDCIIIFPESPGSIAELGFFTHSNTALQKLLLVNDLNFQSDSFINLGLVDKINSKSIFRQTIVIDFKNPDFSLIKRRLEDRLPKSAKTFEYKKFKDLSKPHKLHILFQIIFLFRALKFESVVHCFNQIFGTTNEKQVKHILSILIAAKYVERRGDDLSYFVPSPKALPFLEFKNYDVNDLQAKATEFFRRDHPETFNVIRG
jgi:hypothetical protein